MQVSDSCHRAWDRWFPTEGLNPHSQLQTRRETSRCWVCYPGRYVLQATIGTNVWIPPIGSPESLLTMTIDLAGRLTAPLRPASDELLWAREPIDVGDSDVRDVLIDLHAGARFEGRVEFDGALPRPSTRAAVPILLEPVDNAREGAGAPSQLDAEWRFQTAPYPPGRYRLIVGIPDERWRLRSILVGGRDVTFGSVELGMTDISNVVVTLDDRKRGRISGQDTGRCWSVSLGSERPRPGRGFPSGCRGLDCVRDAPRPRTVSGGHTG